MDPVKLKKDDVVVYHNRILKIDKIKLDKKEPKKSIAVAVPYFVTRKGLNTKFSIPFGTFQKANIRKIMNKGSVQALLKSLQNDDLHDGERVTVIDIVYAELTTEDIVALIQQLWDERQRDPSKFATSKKLLYSRLSEMFAHVVGATHKVEREKAKEMIQKRLDNRDSELSKPIEEEKK